MAKLSQLLLFDPDPSGLETLTYAFGKDGIGVTGMGDVRKARELLETTSASLVLVSLHGQEQGGLDLIRAAATTPRTRGIPCLALGPEELRAPALAAGAFGFLPSPLFVRDVIDAAKLAAAATVPGSRPSPDTEVSVALGEIGGVYFLIRALAASGRSAAVEIQRRGRRGELRFLDGHLSSVQLGTLSGMAALTHLLLWEEADLRLKFRNVVRRGGQMSLKNEEIIEQCDRFLRDFAHEVRDMGTARTVYRPSDRSVQPTSALPSEVVPLLRLFDGQRDLAQVLDESPFRTFDTLRIARQFMLAGAVITDPPFKAAPLNEVAIASGPAALDSWFERKVQASPETPAATNEGPSRAAAVAGGRSAEEGAPGARHGGARGTGVPSPMTRPSAGPFLPLGGPANAGASKTAPPARSPTLPLTPPRERAAAGVPSSRRHSGPTAAPLAGADTMKTPPPVVRTAATTPSAAPATGTTAPIAAIVAAAVGGSATPRTPAASAIPTTTAPPPPAATVAPTAAIASTPDVPAAPPAARASAAAAAPELVTPRPTRSSSAIARGEIHVTPVTPRKAEDAPKAPTPTVMVEPEVMPTPKPVVTLAPDAVAARPASRPRDLPGPETPPPLVAAGSSAGIPHARTLAPTSVTAPPRPRAPSPAAPVTQPEAEVVTPPPLPVAAAAPSRAARPARSLGEPAGRTATPIPALRTPPPSAAETFAAPAVVPSAVPAVVPAVVPALDGTAAPSPDATNPTAATTKKGAVPGPHRSRTPSNGFSAVEADFFNREADLYKPAESFDDLDANNSSPDLAPGKRRPAR